MYVLTHVIQLADECQFICNSMHVRNPTGKCFFTYYIFNYCSRILGRYGNDIAINCILDYTIITTAEMPRAI